MKYLPLSEREVLLTSQERMIEREKEARKKNGKPDKRRKRE